MKLTKEEKEVFKKHWGDWEVIHGEYDRLMGERLRKVDPEFCKDLQKIVKGATFWYA